ncbi:MAG TPA: PIN domain-containing protein [Candidatus Paceibacterota bacterium]|nr:PIN domain-containing protein [Verrucomicrobiota bacterium]HOX01088.1 PIN domain-containing protein [Verrucomicrobiota bacterium]HRZ44064.1 PIN domain-containing protein [Candidatus Paceibacterota bacterium]HRZ92805.1 PIN domain-containing protein [Candidatus Paceibacterota bacterium]
MIVIVDTGPLVALIDPDTTEHPWMRDQARALPRPLLTSEPVLTEAAFLLTRDGFEADELFALAEAGVIEIGIEFNQECSPLRSLMRKYRGVPMSLADATLVRLSELHRECIVLTLDADFRIYRRNRNQPIPLLMPEK